MPVWTATPVSLTPTISISSYGFFRTDRGEVHIMGYNLTQGEGRVSGPIKSFNRRTRVARTRSGRRYELQGDPGFAPEGLYVLRVWLEVNSVKAYRDVTELMMKSGLKVAMQAAEALPDARLS